MKTKEFRNIEELMKESGIPYNLKKEWKYYMSGHFNPEVLRNLIFLSSRLYNNEVVFHYTIIRKECKEGIVTEECYAIVYFKLFGKSKTRKQALLEMISAHRSWDKRGRGY